MVGNMAGISVSGIGSGLDLNALVTQLVAAQSAPANARLDAREAGFQARISAYGTLKSALSQFQSSAGAVSSAASFSARTATSGDSAVFTASAQASAASAVYSVEVSQLAQAQKLASGAFTSVNEVVGEGDISIRFGSFDSGTNTFSADPERAIASITIDSSNNTLAGIRDAINAATDDLRANIVNDGSGERLVFSSAGTGANSAMEITISGDGDGNDVDDSGLSKLAYDAAGGAGTGKNLIETAAALDAAFTVDGLAITRGSNNITDVIEGVTLNLNAASSSGAQTLTVSRDTASASGAVEQFVGAFNTLANTFETLAGYDADTGIGGLLQSDSLLRGVQNQVRRITTDVVDGLSDTSLRSLTDIGISTGEGGILSLDTAALNAALEDSPEALAGLFAVNGLVSDSAVEYLSASSTATPGEYAVEVTQLATRGVYAGATASSLVIDASNDSLSVLVDGVQSASIDFTQKTYGSQSELAAELQARINADEALADAGITVSVSYVSDHYEVVSTRYGSDSSVSVTAAGSASATTLGIGTASGASTDGSDVVGSIGGLVASGSGQQLTGAGAAAGLVLEVSGTTIGSRGSVIFSRGVAAQLNDLLTQLLDTDAALESSIEGLNGQVEQLGEDRSALELRLAAVETRLRSQFAALDALLSQLQTTSSFLTQQLAAIPTPGSRNTR